MSKSSLKGLTQHPIIVAKKYSDPNIGQNYKGDSIVKSLKHLSANEYKLMQSFVKVLEAAKLPVTEPNLTKLNDILIDNFQDIALNLTIENLDKFDMPQLKIGDTLRTLEFPMMRKVEKAIILDTREHELPDQILFEDSACCVNPYCSKVGQVIHENRDGDLEYYCLECHISYKWISERIKNG